MKPRVPGAIHHKFRDDLVAVFQKHATNLTPAEMLALAAHIVGQLIALQDQRTITPAMALEIVAQNIEQGNREVFISLDKTEGSA